MSGGPTRDEFHSSFNSLNNEKHIASDGNTLLPSMPEWPGNNAWRETESRCYMNSLGFHRDVPQALVRLFRGILGKHNEVATWRILHNSSVSPNPSIFHWGWDEPNRRMSHLYYTYLGHFQLYNRLHFWTKKSYVKLVRLKSVINLNQLMVGVILSF